MKITDLIEHGIVADTNFKMPSFSGGEEIDADFPVKAGLRLQVWEMKQANAIGYALVDPVIGPTQPITFVTLVPLKENIYEAVVALTDLNYRGQGYAISLFYYLVKYKKLAIISDDPMTKDGENLWQRMLKTPQMGGKLYNKKTDQRYDIKMVGQNVGGVSVMEPQEEIGLQTNWRYMIERAFQERNSRLKGSLLLQEMVTFND